MRYVLSVLTFFFVFSTLRAQTLLADTSWKSTVTALLNRDVPDSAPGGAIGIVYRGEIIYEGYAGLADLDTETALGPRSRFNMASCAKQFTALAILDLVRTHDLRLEQDIRVFFPELFPAVPEGITIMHLLTHTSGIRDVYDLWGLQGYTWWEESFTNDDAYDLLALQRELNFPPGSRYAYSNSNYILLAKLTEQLTGKSFGDFTAGLFRRWGMSATRFSGDRPDAIPHLARPYFSFDDWLTYDWITRLEGDGALFTTLPDQLTFEILAQRPYLAGGANVSTIGYAQTLPAGYPGSYGYGLEHGEYGGRPYRYHYGSTGAWKATVFRFPEEELSIVAMNNSGKFFTSTLVREVADLLLKRFPPKTDFPSLATSFPPARELTGIYTQGGEEPLRYLIREDTLTAYSPFGKPVSLEAIDGGCFVSSTDERERHCFQADGNDGRIVEVNQPNRGSRSLFRQPPAVVPFKTITWEGDYRNEELDVDLNISATDGGEYRLRLGTQDERKAVPFGDRLFVAPGLVIRAADGTQTGELLLQTGRVRNLRFR